MLANAGLIGALLAASGASSVQCYVIGRLNIILQNKFSAHKPAGGARQWSMSYIIGCALATITIYCNCFGEQFWELSQRWVSLLLPANPCHSEFA